MILMDKYVIDTSLYIGSNLFTSSLLLGSNFRLNVNLDPYLY